MKNGFLGFLILMAGLLSSCVSVQDKILSPQERENVEIIGRANTKFISWQPFHLRLNKNISQKAYSRLLEEARRNYQGNIEVVNVNATGHFNPLTVFPMLIYFSSNIQTIKASGDVILYSGTNPSGIPLNTTNAVKKATETLVMSMPRNSTIAVLSVFSNNTNTSEYIIGEIEFILVNSGQFRIVDRRRLDQIRVEQNFQLSGEVSDDSAISIGNMLGANIVITGEISGSGMNQRLILKALDVRTAQIISMARENL